MIYLDANATTRILPAVLDEMLPWLREGYANPSGAHTAGKKARQAVERAREQVAALIGAAPSEIIFTGGGTESVNTALRSLDRLAGPGHAVVSAIEHSAVLKCVEQGSREVVRLAVTAGGRIDLDLLDGALENAAYLSLMAVNNETGVIQPLQQAAAIARGKRVPVHSDAIQAVGKILFNVREAGVDMASLSAHKFLGPKGVGALYVRSGLRFEPLVYGGGQESGRRSGTENVAGIVGMGAAAEIAMQSNDETQIRSMRDTFEARVLSEISGVKVNGDTFFRLPNTSHLSFDGCDAAGMLILLDEAGIACSAGSACMTGKQQPSHVQLAMGIPPERAKTSLRFGFSRLNTMDEALAAAAKVKNAVEKLRRVQGSGVGPVSVYSP